MIGGAYMTDMCGPRSISHGLTSNGPIKTLFTKYRLFRPQWQEMGDPMANPMAYSSLTSVPQDLHGSAS